MLPPATWYPDPSGRHEHRYWDGTRWTEHVADAGIAAIDHLPSVTADEQVDGGVAADIAAVAMAATSTVEESDRGDTGEGPASRRPRSDDGAPDRDGEPGDDQDAEAHDPWREASSTWFVMPPDAIASLADHAAAPSVPTFTGLDVDGTDVGAAHGVARAGDGITAIVDPAGDGVVAATRWIRRVVGTCELEPTTPAWTRRVVGDGTLTLLPDGASTLVAPVGVDRVVVRSDAVVAVPGATRVESAGGLPAVGDAVVVTRPAWLAVTAPEGASLAPVDGARRLPTSRVVAWTDGLECVEVERGVVLFRGSGSVLVDGRVGD